MLPNVGYLIASCRTTVVNVIDDSDHPGARLKQLRVARGLGLREAARLSENAVTHTQISNIEAGITPWAGVKLGTLEGLARAYGIPFTRLVELANGRTSEVRELQEAHSGKKLIPIYNMVSAGEGADGGEIVGTMEIDATRSGKRVGYLIEGDSMMPEIKPGARIEVVLQDHAQPGETIVAYTAEHGMVCKLLHSITADGHCILTSHNAVYPPLFIHCDEIHIKGIVKEVRNPVVVATPKN